MYIVVIYISMYQQVYNSRIFVIFDHEEIHMPLYTYLCISFTYIL